MIINVQYYNCDTMIMGRYKRYDLSRSTDFVFHRGPAVSIGFGV